MIRAGMAACLLGVAGVIWSLPADQVFPSLTPPPGAYRDHVRLTASLTPGVHLEMQLLGDDHGDQRPWPGSLDLDAVAGETRVTVIRLTAHFPNGDSASQEATYTVTGTRSALPTVSPAPGWFDQPVRLRGSLPAGWSLWVDGQERSLPLTLDPGFGQSATNLVDLVGPRGVFREWRYVVDRRDQPTTALEVLSPRKGRWANTQTLLVSASGAREVRWNWGDHFDLSSSQSYDGPVDLPGSGDLVVTVAACSRADGTWIPQTIRWNQSDSFAEARWPRSTMSSKPLAFPAMDSLRASLDEGVTWQTFSSEGWGTVIPGVERRIGLQLASEQGLVRCSYVIDGRPLSEPQIQEWGGWNPQLSFSGLSDRVYKVRWEFADGTTQGDDRALWGPSGAWKIPDHCVGATVSLVGSDDVRSVVSFPQTGLVAPEVKVVGDTIVTPVHRGFWPVFTIANQEPPPPNHDSPLLTGRFALQEPPGGLRTWFVRVAWRDLQGLVGPPSTTLEIHRDRVPPSAPLVNVSDDQVVMSPSDPSDSVAWCATPAPVEATWGLIFKPYEAPLSIAELTSEGNGTVWVHAVERDRFGNVSETVRNVKLDPPPVPDVVQTDESDPSKSIAVTDGAVYPWRGLRLVRAHPDSSLWVGLVEGTSPPSDWQDSLLPWTIPLTRAVSDHERKTFCVFWNRKSDNGWEWGDPKRIVITLDRGGPAPLTVTPDVRPTDRYPALDVKPGQRGDLVYYTVTQESATALPEKSGLVWPGTWVGTPYGDSHTDLRFAFQAKSVSGVWGPVTEVPVTMTAVNESLRWDARAFQSERKTVRLPALSQAARYTISTDGSWPPVPQLSSREYPQNGLLLAGLAATRTVYRIRVRSLAQADDSDDLVVTRVVDRRTDTPRQSPASLEGAPPKGLTNQAVNLTVAPSHDTEIRREIVEGQGPLPTVTAASPLWDGPLALAGIPKRDVTYTIAWQSFDKDGNVLSPVSRTTIRIDRQAPPAPIVKVDRLESMPGLRLTVAAVPQGERTEVRWDWSAFPSGQGESSWSPLVGELEFEAPQPWATLWNGEVRSVDEAGNVGPSTSIHEILDQKTVYAVAGASGTGTRTDPVGSLVQAVKLARATGKSQVLVGTGQYSVTGTLDVSGLHWYGGLDPHDWQWRSPNDRSLVVAASPFQGVSLIESAGESWSLSHVDLSNGTVPLDVGVSVTGGTAEISESTWQWTRVGMGWRQSGGQLALHSVGGWYHDQSGGHLFSLHRVDWRAEDVTFESVGRLSSSLVVLDEGSAVLNRWKIVSGSSGAFDCFLESNGGQLVGDHLQVSLGDQTDRATALNLKGTDAQLWNCVISLKGKQANVGVQTVGGASSWNQSQIHIMAGTGFNQGMVFDRATGRVTDTSLTMDAGEYQGAFSLTGGTLVVRSVSVQAAGGGARSWGVQVLGPSTLQCSRSQWTLSSPSGNAEPLILGDESLATGSLWEENQVEGWVANPKLAEKVSRPQSR